VWCGGVPHPHPWLLSWPALASLASILFSPPLARNERCPKFVSDPVTFREFLLPFASRLPPPNQSQQACIAARRHLHRDELRKICCCWIGVEHICMLPLGPTTGAYPHVVGAPGSRAERLVQAESAAGLNVPGKRNSR
jgi:hypothetical protein